METVEEMRAVGWSAPACAVLNIASLNGPSPMAWSFWQQYSGCTVIAGRINTARHAIDSEVPESSKSLDLQHYDPVQALANMESISLEAVFILKTSTVIWRVLS